MLTYTLTWRLALIALLILICLLGVFARQSIAAELPRTGKIVVPSKVRVFWDAPADSENVDGYKITAFGSLGSASHWVDLTDSSGLSGIVDVSGIVPDSCITRVRFCVQACNSVGYSAPSDTVSMPMARSRYLFGDLNHDGRVDVKDSATLWRRGLIGTVKGSTNYDPAFDVDADGRITTVEHCCFIANLGRVL